MKDLLHTMGFDNNHIVYYNNIFYGLNKYWRYKYKSYTNNKSKIRPLTKYSEVRIKNRLGSYRHYDTQTMQFIMITEHWRWLRRW